MAESQVVKGNDWLDKAIRLFEALGWEQHGSNNVDIKIPWGDHEKGIDAYFVYYDPFEETKIGIFLEAKNYQMESVTPSFLEKTIKKMVKVIDEVPASKEFNEKLNFNQANLINTGVIVLWVNDKFEIDTYRRYLENIKIPIKRNPQKIFLISNDDILRFCSIIETCKIIQQKTNSNNGEQDLISFHYPSLSERSNTIESLNTLTLEYLFSKYIFIKTTEPEEIEMGNSRINTSINILIVLYFDDVKLNNLNLLYNFIIRYQLSDVAKVLVYLYQGDTIANRETLDEFQRLNKKRKNNYFENGSISKLLKFEFDYMQQFKDYFMRASK